MTLTGVAKKTITDRVQLPRLYLAWLTPPHVRAGRCRARHGGLRAHDWRKNSRLYKRLVYDLQIAQNVEARQESQTLSSHFVIDVDAAARSHD